MKLCVFAIGGFALLCGCTTKPGDIRAARTPPDSTTHHRKPAEDEVSRAENLCIHTDQTKVDVDRRIASCTIAIEHGRLSLDVLAAEFNNRGQAKAVKREFEGAISDFDRSIRLDATLSTAFDNRGQAYSALGKHDLAIQDYDRAIKLKPDFARAFRHRGNTYLDKGDCDRAIMDLSAAIGITSDVADFYNDRGVAYRRRNDLRLAIDDFDRAINLKPDSPEALNNRCFARALDGSALDAALLDCNESLRLRPYSSGFLGARGIVFFRMARYKDALSDLDSYVGQHPKAPVFLYFRGLAKKQLGVPDASNDMAAAKKIDAGVEGQIGKYLAVSPSSP